MGAFDNLGQALRWLRSRQQRRQYEIAEAAGITKAMLSAYETGKQNPSIETLDKLLAALGADLSELHAALVLQQGGRLRDLGPGGRAGLSRPTPSTAPSEPLPPDWEGPLAQILDGFNALVRQLHHQVEGVSQPGAAADPEPGERPGPRRLDFPTSVAESDEEE